MQRSHHNNKIPPHILFETVEEDFSSLMDSHDWPIPVQNQEIIKNITTKIVDNLMDSVAKQVVE